MKVEVSIEIDYPAAAVWSLAGAYDGLPMIGTNTAMSRLEDGGRVRVLMNRDGAILWERLLDFSEPGRTLSYEITDTKAFAASYGKGYRGRVTVKESGPRSSIFFYEADFEPTPGFTAEEARAGVVSFAEDCVGGIRRVLSLQPGR